jgi:acyl-CoA reductase-like NAD-dependent aldehyde dehydrogenase
MYYSPSPMTDLPNTAVETAPNGGDQAAADASTDVKHVKPNAPGSDFSSWKTEQPELDRAIAELSDRARPFAALAVREKALLLKEIVPRLAAVAREQVLAACEAKGIDPSSPMAGEEWLAGPFATITNARLLAEALDDIERKGRPRLPRGAVRVRNGRVEVRVHPLSGKDAALFQGFEAYVLLQEGTDRHSPLEEQAAFYQKGKGEGAEGGVSLILGAGNVASISPMDALYKLFVEGRVALIKMSPVNAYLGPFLERAFAPLIERGFMRIVYGGADVGAYLSEHPGIADIHITGSTATHDRIVWGPPGPERDRRKAANDPLLQKPITSELGNVSPVIITPTLYAEDELWFQARAVASQVVNNASFNCNAGKMLVLPKGWRQRGLFLEMLQKALSSARLRRAYYPGALDRYQTLTAGKEVIRVGDASSGELPWTIVPQLDPKSASEALFSNEPFCGIVSEVEVGSTDPAEFLEAATRFCNETLWGTLSATIIAHPLYEESESAQEALERAIRELRYGAIAVNHWPAMVYGLVTPPWGGHPSSTLADVQSGIGFVHNTQMLARVEKAVLRGPLRMFPKPPYFFDNRKMADIGERLTAYGAEPSWGKVVRVAAAALRG